ncbi:SCY1-like protein 2 [Geodia barretti]|nr:SCY1-like protein 2 [Geodia barretti]
MLCYSVYNGGRPLCSSLNNLLSFKQNVETISRVTESGLGEVPHGLRTLVRTMLAVEPSVRPDAMEISKHAFFDEVGVATLRYLDTLYEKGDMERSQYFRKPGSCHHKTSKESNSPEGNSGSKTRIQKQQDGSVCPCPSFF